MKAITTFLFALSFILPLNLQAEYEMHIPNCTQKEKINCHRKNHKHKMNKIFLLKIFEIFSAVSLIFSQIRPHLSNSRDTNPPYVTRDSFETDVTVTRDLLHHCLSLAWLIVGYTYPLTD